MHLNLRRRRLLLRFVRSRVCERCVIQITDGARRSRARSRICGARDVSVCVSVVCISVRALVACLRSHARIENTFILCITEMCGVCRCSL